MEKIDSSCLQLTEHSSEWIKVYVFHDAVALRVVFFFPHILSAPHFISPRLCAQNPKWSLCPGMPKMQRGQQVKGGILLLLLCSSKTPSGVLHPALISPTQGCEPDGGGPKEGHKDDLRDGAPFPWRPVGELGLFTLEKADLIVAFQYTERA